MNANFPQFRTPDIPQLLNQAASLSQQLGLACVEIPCLFISLQQLFSDELHHYFNASGVDEGMLYNNVGALLGDLPHATGQAPLSMAADLVDALRLTERIEQMTQPSATYPHAPLITAMFTMPGPLRHLGAAAGLTTDIMQRLLADTQAPQPTQNPQPAQPTQAAQAGQRRVPESIKANNAPTIEQFCQNMLQQAIDGVIEPAIGRNDEIMRILQILARRTKNNPVLVGEPGTGKTAVVEGLAHRLLQGDIPPELANLKMYQLDLGVIQGISNGEEVMRKLVDELKANTDVVLFIDEIHTLVGANSSADNPIANLLKPEMARGTIKILGATTVDEYTKHIEKDKAFERRFQKVTIDEPDTDSAIKILLGIKNRFERHHSITIPDSVVQCAVHLSQRFITDRRLPDKAIDLLDEAAACLRMEHRTNTLADADIMAVVTRWTGIPMQNMSDDDTERLRHIEEHLHQSVIGQDQAINAVANAIRRSRMGFSDANKPIGSFLFLGTTGVGKTELCKALAEYLFHSRDMIVRIDMSEYQQEHSVARLFGAPPGYVGYDQGGQLTEAVRRKPYSLVLFDEIEKANPKVFETLLQVLDDGRMTDGQGREVNFKNTIVVMTSNMGQDVIMRSLTGTTPTDDAIQRTSDAVVAQLKTRVAPEFINRIDNIIMFLPLTFDDIRKIAKLQLDKTVTQLAGNGITLRYTEAALDVISRHGYQPEYGGRPVKRVINSEIKDVITNMLINGTLQKTSPICCDADGQSIKFSNTDNAAHSTANNDNNG